MSENVLTPRAFERWLNGYKSAWEGRDAAAAAALFTDDAEYFWTPFDPPQKGKGEIAAAWQGAVSQQKDVAFTFEVLAVNGSTGIAKWHTNLVNVPSGDPVQIDGVLVATFSGGVCRTFREWWHSVGRPY